jgi:hypothetical protein
MPVHGLWHTMGSQLRACGLLESTVADLPWHRTRSKPQHCSGLQIVVWHAALEKIRKGSRRWLKRLATLRREQGEQKARTAPGGSP